MSLSEANVGIKILRNHMPLIEFLMECAEKMSFHCISTLAGGLCHSDLTTPLLLLTSFQQCQIPSRDKTSDWTVSKARLGVPVYSNVQI